MAMRDITIVLEEVETPEVETGPLKYCADCAHLAGKECYSPSNMIDRVSGKPKVMYAAYNRIDISFVSGLCGEEARFFEPKAFKQPWWKFWSRL